MENFVILRTIAVFELHCDARIGDVHISSEEFELIREMLGYSSQDPMYDCYPLDSQLPQILKLLGDRLPTGKYCYFLEASCL